MLCIIKQTMRFFPSHLPPFIELKYQMYFKHFLFVTLCVSVIVRKYAMTGALDAYASNVYEGKKKQIKRYK